MIANILGLFELLIICILIEDTSSMTQASKGLRDYCEFEAFNATCGPDSVIIMEKAQYGRMEFGRCVDRDYGYVGCFADVLAHTDLKCSGRRMCRIAIPDPTLKANQPCPKDLSAYLRASYSCLPVTTPALSQCLSSPTVLHDPSGTISSIVAQESGYGAESCPWIIQAQPGQKINITLWDFATTSTKNSELDGRHYCKAYAILKERDLGRSTTVCAGKERIKNVYVTSGHSLELRILGSSSKNNNEHFILKYQAVGCPSLKTGIAQIIQKTEDSITLRCNSSSDSWTLKCEGNKWVGEKRNCSDGLWNVQNVLGNFTSLPVGTTITLVVSVAFLVIVVILVAGLICIRRRRIRQQEHLRSNPLLAPKNPYNTVPKDKDYASTLGMRQGKHRSYGDYACIWDSQYPMTLQATPPQGPHESMYPHMDYRHNLHPPRVGSVRYSDALPPPPPPQMDFDFNPPRVEHIYESPKFERSERMNVNDCDLPMYFEVDPTGPGRKQPPLHQ